MSDFDIVWLDENRQRLVDSGCLPALIKQLKNAAVLNIAVPAMLNLCTEFGLP